MIGKINHQVFNKVQATKISFGEKKKIAYIEGGTAPLGAQLVIADLFLYKYSK